MKVTEEAKALLTEAIFNHRWELLVGYHEVGKMLLQAGVSPETAAKEMNHRVKDLHYAIELAKLYPDVNSVPDGKVVSWYKITKTLPPYEKDKAPQGQ